MMIQSLTYSVPFTGDDERRSFYCAGTFFDEGNFQEAARLWEKLRQAYPLEAMLQFALGCCQHRQGAFDKAVVFYKRALELDPEFRQAQCELGALLLEQAKYHEAIGIFYSLLERQPRDGDTWTLLGGALSKIGEHEGAITCCREALKLNARNAAAMYNLAYALAATGGSAEALESIDAALHLQPQVPMMHLFRASLLLRMGRYRDGWREWEWRLQKKEFRTLNVRSVMPKRWKGESLEGKTLLVWCEQGFGDTIQFMRYLRLAKERGARVCFECQKELIPVASALDGIDMIFERFAQCPEPFDYHVPLASLPLHFETSPQTIPYAEGYLPSDALMRSSDRAPLAHNRLRVGLAWEGSRLNPANHYRSCTPQAFAPLFALPQCAFYGLQHETGGVCLPEAIQHAGVRSMDELAGAIASMDLVITIDTSIAHLAGAMGKDVWLLLSALPDWRWELCRTTTPWYSSMRIFRQTKLGDWGPPLMEAAVCLQERLNDSMTN
jgi:Tfp pilus assembly protein PilF